MEGNLRRGRRQRKEGNRDEDRQHHIDTNGGKEGRLDHRAKHSVRVCLSVITVTTSDIKLTNEPKQTHTITCRAIDRHRNTCTHQ